MKTHRGYNLSSLRVVWGLLFSLDLHLFIELRALPAEKFNRLIRERENHEKDLWNLINVSHSGV